MPRPKHLGDPADSHGDLEKRSDDVVDRKPNTDHVVRSWSATRGRKTTLTETAINEISELVAGGVTVPVASAACGYGSRWVNWSRVAREHIEQNYEPGFEEGQSPYVAWAEALQEAKAAWEASMILKIGSGDPNYKGPAWLLERRLPKYWQERKSVQVDVKTEAQIASGKSTQELEAELASYETTPKD